MDTIVQDPAVKDKIDLNIDENLSFERSTLSAAEIISYPDFDKIDKSLQGKLEYVIRRAKLATSLDDDDIKIRMEIKTDSFEVNSLRNYLLFSCLNLLGEICRADAPTSFLNWLDTTNSPSIRSSREEIIGKAMGLFGNIDDNNKATKFVKSVFAQYRLSYQFESNILFMLKEGLSENLQTWIIENCWIYQDNPLEKWANLQNVKEGYNNTNSVENKRLTNSRKRWDSLDYHQRLFEISQFLEQLFGQYSLSITPPIVKTDKDPIAKVWRDVLDSIDEYRINYLSNSLFNQLGAEGEKFRFNDVKCVFKDNELYVLESEVRDKDREDWLRRLSEWLKTKVEAGSSPGDTIFLYPKNQAFVIAGKPLSSLMEEWIEDSIINLIGQKKLKSSH